MTALRLMASKLGVWRGQAGEVDLVAELAAEHRLVEHVVVVDHRMDDRNLALHVGFREAVVVDRAHVEIAAVAAAGQIELRDAFGQRRCSNGSDAALIGAQVVVLEEGRVGRQDAVPAPGPVGR